MGQKSNPNSLRAINNNHKGYSCWDKPYFNYIIQNSDKILRACCKNTNIYVNYTNIILSHDIIIINLNLLHLYNNQSNISKHRNLTKKIKNNLSSWNLVLKRLYLCKKLIVKFTGLKQVKIKINRTITYSRALPKKVRQHTSFYIRRYNRTKYNYARIGIKLLFLITKEKADVKTLTNFIKENVRTRSRRKKHTDFLKFLKNCLENLQPIKTIKGIKIQIKGRFGHKPKGRSKIWKYQMGTMPLNNLNAPIHYNYDQAQTKLGCVGIKAWLYKTE